MKGLLLKDGYVILKTMRLMLLCIVIFIGVSQVEDASWLFFLYPCLLTGTLPVTLFQMDEKDRWQRYAASLPVSRRTYVTAKYLVGLTALAATVALCLGIHALAQPIFERHLAAEEARHLEIAASVPVPEDAVIAPPATPDTGEARGSYARQLLSVAAASLLLPSILMPLMFRFGSARARIALLIAIGAASAVAGVLVSIDEEMGAFLLSVNPLPLLGIALAIYALSWFLSVVIYQKREL